MVIKEKQLPESPGVYIFRNNKNDILYIGKAADLRKRVRSYFERPSASNASRSDAGRHDYKIEKLISQIKKIDYKKTETTIEALILESQLIKKFRPPFNIKEKDGKSFLYVDITKDKFPRVLLGRGKGLYGPFTSASSIREALRITRRIFPFSIHPPEKIEKFKKPCFEAEIGLCPGTCIGKIGRAEYLKNIKNIKLFFEGKKRKIVKSLEKQMNLASKKLEFEKAEKVRRRIFSLRHIQDIALIRDEVLEIRNCLPTGDVPKGQKLEIPAQRVEGYDVSNISGTSATGAMVVFVSGKPAKNEYRKFKIKTILKSDDIGMLKEVLRRRFRNSWPLPNLVLIDGGKGQVNAAKEVLDEFGLAIPVIGIAKGEKRKADKIIGGLPTNIDEKTIIRIRNEAHRFAVFYHKNLRNRKFFDK